MADIAAPNPDDDQQTPAADPQGSEPQAAAALEPIATTEPLGSTATASAVEPAVSPLPPEAEAVGAPPAEPEAVAVGGETTPTDEAPSAAAWAPAATTEPAGEPAPIAAPEPIAAASEAAAAAPAPPSEALNTATAEPEPIAAVEASPEAPVVPAERPSEPPSPVAEPTIASTIEMPARVAAEPAGEGGEWALLQQKLSQWLSSGELQQQWQAARKPLSLLAGLIALLLVLRLYNGLLAVIEGLPLVPGLLELVGVIAVARFSLTRLVRSDERQALVQGLQQRWNAFRGKG